MQFSDKVWEYDLSYLTIRTCKEVGPETRQIFFKKSWDTAKNAS